MKNKTFRLVALLIIFLILSVYYFIKNNSVCGEFEYVLYQSTGLTTCIAYNGKVLPINIDDSINPSAYYNFNWLKPNIELANAQNGRIVICGCYNMISHRFKFMNWYIKSPFLQLLDDDENWFEKPITIISRKNLTMNDFDHPIHSNPYDKHFNPAKHVVKSQISSIVDKYDFGMVDIDEGWLQRNFQDGHILKIVRFICFITLLYILLRNNFFQNFKNNKIRIVLIIVIGLIIALIGYLVWIFLGYLAYYFCWNCFVTFTTTSIDELLYMFAKFIYTSVYSLLFSILSIALIKKLSQPKSE